MSRFRRGLALFRFAVSDNAHFPTPEILTHYYHITKLVLSFAFASLETRQENESIERGRLQSHAIINLAEVVSFTECSPNAPWHFP